MSKDKESIDLLPEEPVAPKRPRRSLVRRIYRISRNILLSIFSFLLVLTILLQMPFFQTWMGRIASKWLSSNYGVSVTIDRVAVNFFNGTIKLKHVLVQDHRSDTLIQAGLIKGKLKHIKFGKGEIVFKSLIVHDAYLNMRKYVGDTKPNLSLLIDRFKGEKKREKKEGGKKWLILSASLILEESTVRIRNDQQTARDADFLPNDIHITDINGKLSDFTVKGDSIMFKVNEITATESSGLYLREFRSEVLICPTQMTFKNFLMRTPRSNLSGYYSMRYTSWSSFSHFIDSVTMVADLDLSHIDMKDIAFFSGNLRGFDADFRFRGGVKGTLRNLKGRNIAVYFGSITQLVGSVEMTGLPDINNTFIFFDLNKLITNYNDLSQIPVPPFSEGKKLNIPIEVARLGVMKFSGNYTGFIRDFTAFGNLETGIGSAAIDITLHQDNNVVSYYGDLDVKRFDIGKLLGQKILGKVSLTGHVKGKEFSFKKADATFSGTISSLEFNNYEYTHIKADAGFKDQTFSGFVTMDDPNAKLVFDGSINFSERKNPVFDFVAEIERVNLSKLHLIKSDSTVRLRTKMQMNSSGSNFDNLLGYIKFNDTQYRVGSNEYSMDSLVVNSRMKRDSVKQIEIQSDFVDAEFNGKFKFESLFNELKKRMNQVLPSLALKVNPKIPSMVQDFDYNVHVKQSGELTSLFIPKLSIAANSIIYGNYNSERQDLALNAKSSSIRYDNFEWQGLSVNAANKDDELKVQTKVETFFLTDSVRLDNIKLNASVFRDSMDISIGFLSETERLNAGYIHGKTFFGNPPRYEIRLTDSYFYYNDTLLRVNNNNLIVLDKNSIEFENLRLTKAGTKDILLTLNGRSSKGSNDSLQLGINNFPIDVFNFLLARSKIELDGLATGTINLHHIFDVPYFTSDTVRIREFAFNKIPLGKLELKSAYAPDGKYLTINTALIANGSKIISVQNGRFYPFRKEDQFNLLADIRNLDISILESFVDPIFSDVSGLVSGSVSVKGNAKDPILYSNINIKNGGIRIVYLNAYYFLSMDDRKDIIVNNSGIRIPLVKMTDLHGGTGFMEGNISHQFFRNIKMDLNITARNLCLMETTEKMNERFYGKAFATGTADIVGPLNDLVVKADLKTEKNTLLSIPIRSTSTVAENNFLVFVTKVMDTTAVEGTDIPAPKGNFTVELSVLVTPDATARIIFDETVGDVLTVTGRSDELRLDLDTKGKFNLFGYYEIVKGNYLFTLQNIINKPFTIKPGSNIAFGGDPYKANINATAIYQASAPLYPIVAPFLDPIVAENFKRATRVNCELTLTNTLSNMLISFNLEVPTADESIRNLVKATINTEEEMNRQVFALLVLNSFLPPEATGGVGSTNLLSSGLGSTSLELLSGQLNNWISKLTTDVNLKIKYEGAADNKTEQLNVALSTQLLNDRILIDTDVGIGGQKNIPGETQQTQIVGNVTVEFKVNKKGNVRLKAFNRSNDNNLLKNSATYTQGVGLSYRIDFDNWADLFKSRKRKEREKAIQDSINNVIR